MTKFNINNLDDLYTIKKQDNCYDEINIYPDNITKKGVLRYALKYTYWKLKINGKLIIHLNDNNFQSFATKEISNWQYLVTLNLLFPNECQNIKNNKNYILLTKKNREKKINGISLGIIFSGNEQEVQLLDKAISELNHYTDINYEIIICGPSTFNFINVKIKYNNLNIKYIPFDIRQENDRIFLSEKKNYLYKSMKYDIRVIAHTRIKYPPNFIQTLLSKTTFDIATPHIIDNQSNPYLDLVLIGSYDVSKLNPKESISRKFFGQNYLNYMSNRVAYVDGGIIILNSQNITWEPFDNEIAWGEGEDLDLARVAYSNGLLIDIIDDITCISMTNKLQQAKNLMDKIKFSLKKFLISKGVI